MPDIWPEVQGQMEFSSAPLYHACAKSTFLARSFPISLWPDVNYIQPTPNRLRIGICMLQTLAQVLTSSVPNIRTGRKFRPKRNWRGGRIFREGWWWGGTSRVNKPATSAPSGPAMATSLLRAVKGGPFFFLKSDLRCTETFSLLHCSWAQIKWISLPSQPSPSKIGKSKE
jgi:hypothetical protein